MGSIAALKTPSRRYPTTLQKEEEGREGNGGTFDSKD
jgi:hypothetical protein